MAPDAATDHQVEIRSLFDYDTALGLLGPGSLGSGLQRFRLDCGSGSTAVPGSKRFRLKRFRLVRARPS